MYKHYYITSIDISLLSIDKKKIIEKDYENLPQWIKDKSTLIYKPTSL